MSLDPRRKGPLATVVVVTLFILVFANACSGEKTNISSDSDATVSSESESFDFSTYDSSYKDKGAFDTLKAEGLSYGEQMVSYDGITSCKSGSTTFGTQKNTNGMQITVIIEKDAVDDMPSAILQTALQAAALQKATSKSVSVRLCVPDPDKPKGQGYVVYPVCISYDVAHPAPDKPADVKAMLAAANQWEVYGKNSALGDTIDSLGLS